MADDRRAPDGRARTAMTARPQAAILRPMLRHAWFLLLCLLAASLVATVTAHAQESVGVAAMGCSGEVHAEGDADQVPPDADQSVPHHHGSCHGHGVPAPVHSAALALQATGAEAPRASDATRLAATLIDPALEPPRG